MALSKVGGKPGYDYFWKDPATSTVGMGFRHVDTQNNIKLNTNALGGQLTVTPTNVRISAEVARIEVKTDKPNSVFSGSFKAEALTASAGFGLQGDLFGAKVDASGKTSTSGITVFSAGGEAQIAKTTITGGIKLGPVNIQLSGSVGYGAAASASIGAGKNGFGASAQAGVGATVGLGFQVTWDSAKVGDTIAKATLSASGQNQNQTTSSTLPAGWVDRKLADTPSPPAPGVASTAPEVHRSGSGPVETQD